MMVVSAVVRLWNGGMCYGWRGGRDERLGGCDDLEMSSIEVEDGT